MKYLRRLLCIFSHKVDPKSLRNCRDKDHPGIMLWVSPRRECLLDANCGRCGVAILYEFSIPSAVVERLDELEKIRTKWAIDAELKAQKAKKAKRK